MLPVAMLLALAVMFSDAGAQSGPPGAISGVLNCSAHLTDPIGAPAFSTPLSFRPAGSYFKAERQTGSRPGLNSYDLQLARDGRIRVEGIGSYESGRSWRWSFNGRDSGEGRAVTRGSMFQAGRDGIERAMRSCTLALLLPAQPPPTPSAQLSPRPTAPPKGLVPRGGEYPLAVGARDQQTSERNAGERPNTGSEPANSTAARARELAVAAAPPEKVIPQTPQDRLARDSVPASELPVTCGTFYEMDRGLTESAWRVVSRTPLDHLSSAQLAELTRIAAACRSSRNGSAPLGLDARIALMRVEDGLQRLTVFAQRREQDEANVRRRDQEQDATAQAQILVLEQLSSIAQEQAAQPITEACQPTVRETEARLSDKGGADLFRRQISTTMAWRAYVASCSARDEQVRQAAASRAQQELSARPQRVRAAIATLVEQSLVEQRAKVNSTEISQDVLRLTLVMKPGFATFLSGADASLMPENVPTMPLESWIALIARSHPTAVFSPAHSENSPDPAFAMKAPGERTVFVSFHRDGDELFPEKMQLSDQVLVDTPSSMRTPLTAAIINLSGLPKILADMNSN